MAFNLSTIVASGIVVGGIAVGTLTFTQTDALNNVSQYAKDFKDKIFNLDTSLENWKTAFGDLKINATEKITEANSKIQQANSKIAEANTKIAEKSALITSLQTQLADLQSQISTGEGNADTLTQEVERLNSELTKANNEVASLEAEIVALNGLVADKGNTIETADSTALPTVQGVTDTPTETPVIEEEEEEPAPTETPVTPPVTPPTDVNPTVAINGYTGASQTTMLTTANEINVLTPVNTYNVNKIDSLAEANTIVITVDGTFTKPTGTALEPKYDLIRQTGGNKMIRVVNSTGTTLATRGNTGWTMN